MTISDEKYGHPDHVGDALLRLDAILAPTGPLPISRSGWWAGVKSGRYPKPVRLGPRSTAWRASDIRRLVQQGTHEP
jgi:predicted DNA-binding transcriptional regulator AlpA